MNIGHHNDSTGAPDDNPDPRDFEATLRELHAQAVERVPMRTLLQLRHYEGARPGCGRNPNAQRTGWTRHCRQCDRGKSDKAVP